MRKYKFTDLDGDVKIVETRWLKDAIRKLKRIINEEYPDNGPIPDIDSVGSCFPVGIKHYAYIDSIVSSYLKNIEVIDD